MKDLAVNSFKEPSTNLAAEIHCIIKTTVSDPPA